ncbi:hypothetical protein VTL71DRAFT_11893 [Oculimacula yallundae]|uniref:DNA2/NAM7 helicase-like C-terminal domain-containing protein n=1 Tax=Oculimacula yallundae TaxID=86028 RepID=A0ABR4CRQ8_9HELO
MSQFLKEMQLALDTQKGLKIAGVYDSRLQHPEYSLAYRVLEIINILPQTAELQAKNPQSFATAQHLWNRQYQEILGIEETKNLKLELEGIRSIVAVLNVRNTQTELEGSSRFNTGLIAPHMEVIKMLTQLTPGRVPTQVVLAPYKSHLDKLKRAFEVLQANNPALGFAVEFGTIDAFQGRDAEFASIAYPNVDSSGFTANAGRFVSSGSRHKHGLVLIADCVGVGKMAKAANNPYLAFIESIKQNY